MFGENDSRVSCDLRHAQKNDRTAVSLGNTKQKGSNL